MKVNVLLGLNESEESVSRAKLLKLKEGDKITGYFITRKKIKVQTLTLKHPARDYPPKDTSQMWEWIVSGSSSSIEIALGGEQDAYKGQFVVTKIANGLTEAKDDDMTDEQLGVIGGKLEDLVQDVSFDVTNGIEIGENEYRVFFQWEGGERGEKHGKGSATFKCGFQEHGRAKSLVAVDFDLLDLTGIRGVNIDQSIFK